MILPADDGTVKSVLDEISEVVNEGIVNVRMHPSAASNLLRPYRRTLTRPDSESTQQSASMSSVSFIPTAGAPLSH
jgi:hypothetical protein